MQGLQDPHAKVRWAACQALGQMCTDLGPDIQNDEHAVILPALTQVMKDFNEPRVQAHAAAAIVNFSENCDEDILTGYMDDLITQLLSLLQNGQKLVKVSSLLCLRLTHHALQGAGRLLHHISLNGASIQPEPLNVSGHLLSDLAA